MQELEVTFGRAAQIWWAWVWRAVLFGMLSSFPLGLLVSAIGIPLGFNALQLMPVSMILGAIAGIIISIWAQGKILKKKFSTFRIALVQD
jgi:hypothetical protein